LQRRHAAELQDWETRLIMKMENARLEIRQELHKEMQTQQMESAVKLQELQAALESTRTDAEAARSEAASAEARVAAQTSPTAGPGVGVMSAETQEKLASLEGKVERLGSCEEQARASADQLRELRGAIQKLCLKHHVGLGEAASQDLLTPLDAELARLKGEQAGAGEEAKVAREQLQKHQELAAVLRHSLNEAEDKVKRLTSECKELDNRGSADLFKLQTKLQEAELQASQTSGSLKAEAESCRRRCDEAEERSRQMQPRVERLDAQLRALEEQFAEEQKLRKRYHNQIQDMKGVIRVFCRFRPMIAREAGESPALRRVDAMSVEITRPPPHTDVRPFGFDSVFDSDSTQEEVFADCRELVQSAVDGYNVTIFAYGQTGAGKTHTMYGTPQQPGLAPRSIQCLFDIMKKETPRGKTFKVKTYMVEVYKQDILDLLADKPPPSKDGKTAKVGLEVKKDLGRGMMYVEGVKEKVVTTPEELMATLSEGEKKRHVTATKMNSASSRSHLLLSIIIECTVKDTGQILYGKITLCDLAGSERPKKSEVSGDALKEAIEINKSLSALGDVIEALTKGAKSIPYRNHKLTMLMQDSLGGSAKCLMFVNCSPAGSNYEETMMSLKWASRARQVTNDVKRNADSKEVARLKQVISMMGQAQNAESILDDQPQPGEGAGGDAQKGSMMDLEMAMNATMRG